MTTKAQNPDPSKFQLWAICKSDLGTFRYFVANFTSLDDAEYRAEHLDDPKVTATDIVAPTVPEAPKLSKAQSEALHDFAKVARIDYGLPIKWGGKNTSPENALYYDVLVSSAVVTKLVELGLLKTERKFEARLTTAGYRLARQLFPALFALQDRALAPLIRPALTEALTPEIEPMVDQPALPAYLQDYQDAMNAITPGELAKMIVAEDFYTELIRSDADEVSQSDPDIYSWRLYILKDEGEGVELKTFVGNFASNSDAHREAAKRPFPTMTSFEICPPKSPDFDKAMTVKQYLDLESRPLAVHIPNFGDATETIFDDIVPEEVEGSPWYWIVRHGKKLRTVTLDHLIWYE